MYTKVEKPKEDKSRAVANSVGQNKSGGKQGFGFVDNRPVRANLSNLKKRLDESNPSKVPVQLYRDSATAYAGLVGALLTPTKSTGSPNRDTAHITPGGHFHGNQSITKNGTTWVNQAHVTWDSWAGANLNNGANGDAPHVYLEESAAGTWILDKSRPNMAHDTKNVNFKSAGGRQYNQLLPIAISFANTELGIASTHGSSLPFIPTAQEVNNFAQWQIAGLPGNTDNMLGATATELKNSLNVQYTNDYRAYLNRIKIKNNANVATANQIARQNAAKRASDIGSQLLNAQKFKLIKTLVSIVTKNKKAAESYKEEIKLMGKKNIKSYETAAKIVDNMFEGELNPGNYDENFLIDKMTELVKKTWS